MEHCERVLHFMGRELESRGPGRNGDENGRKMDFGLTLKNGGKMAQKMRKIAQKMENMARKWFENGISGHFSHFPGHVSPIF